MACRDGCTALSPENIYSGNNLAIFHASKRQKNVFFLKIYLPKKIDLHTKERPSYNGTIWRCGWNNPLQAVWPDWAIFFRSHWLQGIFLILTPPSVQECELESNLGRRLGQRPVTCLIMSSNAAFVSSDAHYFIPLKYWHQFKNIFPLSGNWAFQSVYHLLAKRWWRFVLWWDILFVSLNVLC